MATLTARTIQSTYKDLLQVSNSNAGVDATLRSVEDGEGTASPLQLSTAKVRITGVNTNVAALEVYNTDGADVNFSVNPYGELLAAGDVSFLTDLYVTGNIYDATWAGDTIGVGLGGTGLTAGTSGGVLAYTATGTLASSAALTANVPIIGGGAGAAPTVATGLLYASGGPHLTITAQNAAYVPLVAKGATSQTASLQEWQDNSATVLASINSSGGLSCDKLVSFKSNIKVETGTTYTLLATDTGKVIEFTNGSAITVTLPNSFAVGFTVAIVQAGGGQITLSPASGATMVNARSHTKTYGQDACANIYVTTNSGGSSAAYRLSGDTAS